MSVFRGTTSAMAAGWLLSGCALLSCAPESAAGKGHVLLITLDTARADRFSYAGASPVSTPHVDALAGEGTAFLAAVSPAPITLVAHASLLTGLLPPDHGVRNNGTYTLRDEAITLTELLKERGYRTGAFVGAAVLDARYGLDQGFDRYDDEMSGKPGAEFEPQRTADVVVDRALDWLDSRQGERTFVWAHLFDPHTPYEPPEPERSLHRNSPYDGEIAYADRQIGRLLAGYRRRGLYEDAIIVFASDHGEGLDEHGEPTHGIFLFDTTVRVPLIVRFPGTGNGRRVGAQVQLVDILPTLAEFLDLEVPPGVRGRSLVPRMQGASGPAPPAYLETRLPLENHAWFELRGLRSEEAKLVSSGRRTVLYDLVADPDESRDVSASRRNDASAMLAVLDEEFAERGPGVSSTLQVDEDTLKRLSALGYVGSAPPEPGREATASAYAEKRVRLTRELFERGAQDDASRRCRELIGERFATGADCIDTLARDLGRTTADPDAAIENREVTDLLTAAESATRLGAEADLRTKLIELTAVLFAPEEVRRADTPDRMAIAAAVSRIGDACWRALDYENGVHAYWIGSRLVPEDPGFHYNLGLAWERLGDVHEARRAFQRALGIDPGFQRAREHHRFTEAVAAWLGDGGG